ncbi:putative membrane protein [Rhodopirellula sp. SWK7]|nr:putative membrane protein [Rhodopirellula sp. SWK7]
MADPVQLSWKATRQTKTHALTFASNAESPVTKNPYDSPLFASVSTSGASENAPRPTERPVGVSVLAVLHILGGLVLFGVQFLMFARLDSMEESLRAMGIPPVLVIVGVMFLSVLTIASGIGMWMGTRWGWWLAAFYYVYGVLRNASALYTVVSMADQLEGTARGPEFYMIKHSVRIVIQSLLLMYFFKGNVLDYFDLSTLKKGKALGILVGICGTIGAALTALTMIFG